MVQLLLMPDAPPPTKEDRDLANAFAAHVQRVAALLRSGIHENQIVAVRKTSPHRAGTLADLLAVMQTDLRRFEVALCEVAIQASFLDQAVGRGGADLKNSLRRAHVVPTNRVKG